MQAGQQKQQNQQSQDRPMSSYMIDLDRPDRERQMHELSDRYADLLSTFEV